MTDLDRFERRLEGRLLDHVAPAARPFDASSIARAAVVAAVTVRRRPWARHRHRSRASRPLPVLLAGVLVAGLAGAGLVAGDRLLRQDPPSVIVPGPGQFVPTGPMVDPRAFARAVALGDGHVLVLGGQVDDPDALRDTLVVSIEVWDPTSGTFSAAGRLRAPRSGFTATALPDGRVLIVGGDVDGALVPDAEVWGPTAGPTTHADLAAPGRSGHTATLLADGSVLIAGGARRSEELTDTRIVERWLPESGSSMPAGSLLTGRYAHTATLLPDGRVLLVGGRPTEDLWPGETPGGILATAEIWDPATGASRLAGTLSAPRYNHTATLLPDGRVLLIGGGNGYEREVGLTSAEIWDPATETFSATGSPLIGRALHSARLLPSGRVLVLGGGGGPRPDGAGAAELWDPVTGTFSAAADPAHWYLDPAAVPLPDGHVLVVGGYESGTQSIRTSSIGGKVGPTHAAATELFVEGDDDAS